jgi:hypothetical protein
MAFDASSKTAGGRIEGPALKLWIMYFLIA